MPIETDSDGTNDNDGPHCRNCHVGANNCDVCHDDGAANFSAAYTATITAPTSGKSNYTAQTYLRQSAVAGLNGKCIDGGFSFPHRTLGANMLKDELYGIDFDGTVISAGTTRTANGMISAPSSTATFSIDAATDANGFVAWTGENMKSGSIIPAVKNDVSSLDGAEAENLDSVCIDCHGDASYWNGNNPSMFTTPFAGTTSTVGAYGYGASAGWDLLLKGLP